MAVLEKSPLASVSQTALALLNSVKHQTIGAKNTRVMKPPKGLNSPKSKQSRQSQRNRRSKIIKNHMGEPVIPAKNFSHDPVTGPKFFKTKSHIFDFNGI